jgi:hypothetical protein
MLHLTTHREWLQPIKIRIGIQKRYIGCPRVIRVLMKSYAESP